VRRIVILTTSCLAFACAGGGAGRQSSGVAEETSSSSDGTQDTIDPTVFGTSLADESSTAGSTTPTTGPGTTTVDTEDTTATGGEAPSVVMVTPDAEDAVPRDTPITITFSIDMDPDSIVADDGGCTGAVQVSVDDFATCEALEPAVAADARTFVVQPAAGLVSAASHRVRITTAAASAAGTPLLAEHTTRGFTARYGHTIAIDGGDDWAPGETFATSTDGHTAHLAWDDDYVYLGMRSPDVAGGQSSVWVVAYFGGDAGTDQGVLYNTQQPTLPFDAQYHLRWRADNIFTDVLAYDGAQWSPGGWTIGDGDVYAQADLLEMRVARADLGDPETLEVHTGLLREAMLDEASWGACPQTSYEDGYDPDYLAHWSFDLAGSTRPADHEPVQ
jgi:hypothetical protein